MRVVLQRVRDASVTVEGEVTGAIDAGLLLLVAFQETDTDAELRWMARKCIDLRVFNDDEGKMNRSLRDTGGGVLAISQFTLYGDARKGRRPSFIGSAPGEQAEELYGRFLSALAEQEVDVQSGVFGAHMDVRFCNDGPVTLILDREAER